MPYTLSEDYRLKRLAELASSAQTVLDVGCAHYPNKFLLNPKVTGLDLEDASLPNNYKLFINSDVSKLPESKLHYDAVIAGEILEHLEEPIEFLRNCRSCLNENGKIILSTPNPHSIFETFLTLFLNKKFFYAEDHIMLYPQRWLIRMLNKAGFHGVKLYSGGFPIPPFGLIPCPRFLCHQTIAVAYKSPQNNA